MCISILGFNLDERAKYHRRYRLWDDDGLGYTDLLKIQVIELNKKLCGKDLVDEWLRLFNAEAEELDMLEMRTKNVASGRRINGLG